MNIKILIKNLILIQNRFWNLKRTKNKIKLVNWKDLDYQKRKMKLNWNKYKKLVIKSKANIKDIGNVKCSQLNLKTNLILNGSHNWKVIIFGVGYLVRRTKCLGIMVIQTTKNQAFVKILNNLKVSAF